MLKLFYLVAGQFGKFLAKKAFSCLWGQFTLCREPVQKALSKFEAAAAAAEHRRMPKRFSSLDGKVRCVRRDDCRAWRPV